ncbi:MAG: hypothetical protein FWB80_00720 [Defluviitaleaceae bacterium]|nr:hypothetical protein [Defluviitaleaceae bacterium]
MNKEIKERRERILSKYPSINAELETLCTTRRDEIIDNLLKRDKDYQSLTKRRADTSQEVLEVLKSHDKADLFEAYSDAIYEEEVYELSVIYKEAFLDAVEMTNKL